jgi:hypothetical protein
MTMTRGLVFGIVFACLPLVAGEAVADEATFAVAHAGIVCGLMTANADGIQCVTASGAAHVAAIDGSDDGLLFSGVWLGSDGTLPTMHDDGDDDVFSLETAPGGSRVEFCAIDAGFDFFTARVGGDCSQFAGKNTNYKGTDSFTLDSADYNARTISPPSGKLWARVDAQGEGVCALAVSDLSTSTTGDVYCWGGDYAEWGNSPTLKLSGVAY